MKTRIISGLIGGIAAIYVILFGDVSMSVAVGVITLISLYEFFSATKLKDKSKTLFITSLLFGILVTLSSACYYKLAFLNEMLTVYIIFSFCYMVLNHSTIKFTDVAYAILGTIYITVFFNHIILLRHMEYGKLYIWLPFITAWLCDTFAYFTGMAFGKHKLIPKVSPKKTVEGAIGGVLGSVISVVVFLIVCKNVQDVSVNIWGGILLGALCAVVSQFGDLCASCIKREHDVKDFGNLMPGHGGALDRFDSVLMVAPVCYYLSLYLGIIG